MKRVLIIDGHEPSRKTLVKTLTQSGYKIAGEGISVLMSESDSGVRELNPGICQIRGLNGSSHSYVIKGHYMNVMINSGSDQNFPVLERGLFHIGLK
jgi:hypothetical protein